MTMFVNRTMIMNKIIRPADLRIGSASIRYFTSPAVRRYKKQQAVHSKPTMAIARAMPNSFAEFDNGTLLSVAGMEYHAARVEVLKRHIMSVDNVSYDEASKTFELIATKNREGMTLAALPYQIGIAVAVTAAFGSIPMVFDVHTALPFNEAFVTTDVPEDRDLETFLEVGAWTWNWMEPVLGTFSFSLLCLQFSRAQMENLGIRPYTRKLKSMRAKKLAAAFPQYDPIVIHAFSETDPLVQ